MTMRRAVLGTAIGLFALAFLALLGHNLIVEKLTLKRGADAYLVGYPLVTMDATRMALTEAPSQVNAFTHARYLPDASSSVQVVAPRPCLRNRYSQNMTTAASRIPAR